MKKVLFIAVIMIVTLPLMAQGDDGGSTFNIWTIISAVLAIVSTIFGTILAKAKGKIKEIVKLGKETVEAGSASVNLIDVTTSAFDDNTVTPEEKVAIKESAAKAKSEWNDVKVQWKILWGKQ